MDALAEAALEELGASSSVGLGTGRAAARVIQALARRAAAGQLQVQCVATSRASEALARQLGLPLQPLEQFERVDCLLDGADEVDPALRMIKGRGGAMTREKIVAHAAARRVYLVQSEKLVTRLGERSPLPIEVMRFGLAATRRALRELGLAGPVRQGGAAPGSRAEPRASTDGSRAEPRASTDGSRAEPRASTDFETDNGNLIIDAPLPARSDLVQLGAALDAVPGIVGHGLFLSEADIVLSEDEHGRVSRRTRSAT